MESGTDIYLKTTVAALTTFNKDIDKKISYSLINSNKREQKP